MDESSGADAPREDVGSIFLSYSRDDRARAEPVIELLEQAGISVWWDGLIEGGLRYADVTEDALEHAYAVVVLWSKRSVDSYWVRDEATRGRDRGCLVPVSIDGTEPPLGFRQFQYVDISDGKLTLEHPQVQRLIHSIEHLRDGTAGEPVDPAFGQPSPPTRTQIPVSRRAVMLGGASLVVGAGGVLAWQGGLFGGGGKANSLAVLPFDNLGADETDQTFARGLSSEIRSQLARNPLLSVAAEASSNSFRDSTDDAKTISKSLGVAYLLDGNFRRENGRVRVSAELIDGKTGFSVLPLDFDQPVEAIFEIQSAIATAVTQELAAQSDQATASGQLGGTENFAAYDAYLRGKELYDAGIDENSDRQALAKFDEAIRIDPDYAAAHAGRSRTLALIGNLYTQPEQRGTVFGSAVESARRATELAPEFAEGHQVLGFVTAMGQLDMKAARAPYDKAYELGRGDADILSRYAIFRSRIGDFGNASEAIKSATALDPLNARVFRFSGDIAYAARKPREAIAAFEKAKAIQESLSSYHYSVGLAQLELGELEAARESFASDSRFIWQKTGGAIVEHLLGNRPAAEAHLDEMRNQSGDKNLYQYLQIFAQWGELDRARETMAAAWDKRDSGLVQLYQDPLLEPVRETEEYNQLIARLGFV